jgi:hypothetical protein
MQKQPHLDSTATDAWRGGTAEWIAVGALIAGSVGALIGARRCGHRGASARRLSQPDTGQFTPAHGDKLQTALR